VAPRGVAETRAELRAVGLADVHAAARDMLGSGLLQVPDGLDGRWAGFEPAPVSSERQVDGQRYPSVDDPDIRLVIGPSGVGLERAGAPPVAIPFHECAIAMAYPDGGRQLIGFDSLTIRIEPTMYPVPPDVLARIDAAVGPVTVVQPPRDPQRVPTPQAAQPAETLAPARPGDGMGLLVGAVFAFVLSVLALCCSGFWTILVNDSSDPETDIPMDGFAVAVFVIGYGSFFALAILGIYLLRRRNRK
jgi:zinc protease